jgi:pyridinium-3,5-biscarboxylic acid mononucleotide synthase
MSRKERFFMDQERLKDLLKRFKDGETSLDEVIEWLRHLPFESLGFANVDHHRAIRQGFPEVILGQGKTPEQIAAIAEKLLEGSSNLLITRSNPEAYEHVKAIAPNAAYHETCGAISVRRDETMRGRGMIAIVTAGTSDIPVADEAEQTRDAAVSTSYRLYCGNGRRSTECCRWIGQCAGNCCSYQHRLWRKFQWHCRFTGNAQFMCIKCYGRQYR